MYAGSTPLLDNEHDTRLLICCGSPISVWIEAYLGNMYTHGTFNAACGGGAVNIVIRLSGSKFVTHVFTDADTTVDDCV